MLLHGLEGAGDVDDLGDADVLGGAGGGFGGDGAEGGGAALGEDDAVDTGSISGAEQGAEIVRVFDAIEGKEEAVAGGAEGSVEEVFESEEFALAEEGDGALVGVCFAVAGELVARLGDDANAFEAAEFEERVHARVAATLALAGDADVIERPGTRAQGLLDGVQAVQNIHGSSVIAGVGGEFWIRARGGSSCRPGHEEVLCRDGGSGLTIFAGNRDFLAKRDVITNVRTPLALTAEAAKQVERENAAIARGLKRQDPDLLDQLIETYQHRLMRYLMFLTGKREVAEDLFQEVWIRVLRSGSQYNGKARFDTWIFTIARNLVIDLSRKRTMASLDEMREGGEDERPFEIVQDGPSPLEQFQSREHASEVAKVLLTLEPSYREVLTLRFHEEMSLEEIAMVTCAPLSTVKSRLYRGLAALKPEILKLRSMRKDEQDAMEVRP